MTGFHSGLFVSFTFGKNQPFIHAIVLIVPLQAPATGTSNPLMKSKSKNEIAATPFAAMPSFKVTKDPNDLDDFW